jgi:hypothetical protein
MDVTDVLKLKGHLTIFADEHSRKTGSVVDGLGRHRVPEDLYLPKVKRLQQFRQRPIWIVISMCSDNLVISLWIARDCAEARAS